MSAAAEALRPGEAGGGAATGPGPGLGCRLRSRGGVYVPGAAFSKTRPIDRLNKHGVEFSVIHKPEV